MNYGKLNEQHLKEAAGGKLDKLVDLWHKDVADKTGKKIEIVLGNRRDNPRPAYIGMLTEAVLEMKGDSNRLIIWYDSLELLYNTRISEYGYSPKVIEEITAMLREDRDPGPEFDPVKNPDKLDWGQVAALIGRWLMKFRGFRKLKNENGRFLELETFLNLESGIPALHGIFSEAGFDGTGFEQKRLVEVFEGFSNMDEPSRRVDRALNALRVSNILDFCTDSVKRTELYDLLNARFPSIFSFRNEIDLLKNGCRLQEPDGLESFMKKMVLKYRLPGSWVAVTETAGIF